MEIDLNFDNQNNLVKNLKEKINNNNLLLKELERQVKIEQKKLQDLCKHHDFIAENNNDYHRNGYYYTCSKCDLFTTCRPEKYRFN